jgi:hypothetical protein
VPESDTEEIRDLLFVALQMHLATYELASRLEVMLRGNAELPFVSAIRSFAAMQAALLCHVAQPIARLPIDPRAPTLRLHLDELPSVRLTGEERAALRRTLADEDWLDRYLRGLPSLSEERLRRIGRIFESFPESSKIN